MPDPSLPQLRRRLLAWYGRHHRQLPWRPTPQSQIPNSKSEIRTANPYHVLVSEAMLQQTQVATVIPYFDRFVEQFPTVHDLAAADEQQVLRLWQGLGYYRRARHLHAAARVIVDHHAGRVPDTLDELLALPGIGRYTGGAIASIAFGRRAPILDGNVARVLARLFAIDEPTDQPATRDRLWQLAEQVLPRKAVGDFNQAMMELGALVCTPRQPACLVCPLQTLCLAQLAGRQAELPRRSIRHAPKAVRHVIVAIERRGKYLFEQRPATGLWSNMWQMPTHESPDSDAPDSLLPWVRETYGLTCQSAGDQHEFTHQTTHRTIAFSLVRVQVAAGRLLPNRGVWRKLDALDDLPLSNPQRKAVTMLVGEKPTA
ncbi:A/G-specific adenine glycosylase [Phycisphaerales bacterium AB-hyl4]|uniref:Adenine DNA glycosylase n=1 Tax=Natronomicrosphaera hydrolytica TaxID=3242702 RepID=A0ABV4U4J3_9BACT